MIHFALPIKKIAIMIASMPLKAAANQSGMKIWPSYSITFLIKWRLGSYGVTSAWRSSVSIF